MRRWRIAKIAAGHEAAERHDRHRHVDVEDLLHEALVGVERRVEEHERAARSRSRRRWPWRGGSSPSNTSVLEQVVEDGHGEKHEDHIVKREQPQPAPQVLRALRPGATAAPWPARRRSGAARAAGSRSSGAVSSRARVSAASAPTSAPTAATPRSPARGSASSSGSAPPRPGPSRSSAEGGHRHELHRHEEQRAARRPSPGTAPCGPPAPAAARRSRPARAPPRRAASRRSPTRAAG